MICTSRLDDAEQPDEATPLQISTIADTWIHLNYNIDGGERNRRLSIVKARGIGHSNQVREFVLSDAGVTFKDAYTGDGDMLVGSQRWGRERSDELARREREDAANRETARLNGQMTELEGRIAVLKVQLDEKRLEATAQTERTAERVDDTEQTRDTMRDLRGG